MIKVRDSLLYEFTDNSSGQENTVYFLADLDYYHPLRPASWEHDVQTALRAINPEKVITLFGVEDYQTRCQNGNPSYQGHDTASIVLRHLYSEKSSIPCDGLASRKQYRKAFFANLLRPIFLLVAVFSSLIPVIKIGPWQKLLGGLRIGALFIKNKFLKNIVEGVVASAAYLSNTYLMSIAFFALAQGSHFALPLVMNVYGFFASSVVYNFRSEDESRTAYWYFQRCCLAILDWGDKLIHLKVRLNAAAPVIGAFLDFGFSILISKGFAQYLLPLLLKTQAIPFVLQATFFPLLASGINIAAAALALYYGITLTVKCLSSTALYFGFFEKASSDMSVDETLIDRHSHGISDYIASPKLVWFSQAIGLSLSETGPNSSVSTFSQKGHTVIVLPPHILYQLVSEKNQGKLPDLQPMKPCLVFTDSTQHTVVDSNSLRPAKRG